MFCPKQEWLPVLATHCTISDPAWWHSFPVYKTLQSRRVVFRWERPQAESERVYASPLLEAKRYASILQHDPLVKTQADLAREIGVSRVRITQVMSLLRLAPEIQEHLLRLEDQQAIRFFRERRLRPLIQIEDPRRQVEEFQKLLAQVQQ